MPASHELLCAVVTRLSPACTKRSGLAMFMAVWMRLLPREPSPWSFHTRCGVYASRVRMSVRSTQSGNSWAEVVVQLCRPCVFNLVCLLPGFWFRVSVVMVVATAAAHLAGPAGMSTEHTQPFAVISRPTGPKGNRATVASCSRQGPLVNAGSVLGV